MKPDCANDFEAINLYKDGIMSINGFRWYLKRKFDISWSEAGKIASDWLETNKE